ncbi:copper amine oxidase N-terminal domain-containing protein [Schinkia sp. CFF1]
MSNQPKMKKVLNVMTTAALVGGVVAPIVAPITANAANSTNLVDKVVHVDNDYKTGDTATNNIIIKEDDVNFASDDTFRLTLPAGVKWIKEKYADPIKGTDGAQFDVVQVTDQDLELKIAGERTNLSKAEVKVPMYFEVDGAEGELKVTLDSKGSTLTSGQYTFAVVSNGDTATTVSDVKTIGDGDEIGTIRIDELALKSMETGKVTLTLPTKFKWETKPTVTLGNKTIDANDVTITDNKLTITVGDGFLATDKLNTMYISGLSINADKDATYGDIEIQVSGDGITDQDIVVAKYADYSSEVSVKDEAPTLVAGRNNADTKDLKTAEVLVKENVVGSWLSNRDVQIEFPSWAKVVGYEISGVKGFEAGAEDALKAKFNTEIKGDSNEIELNALPGAATGKTREFKVKFYVSTKADAQGDITAKFSGKAGIDGEVVVAKAVAPVKVEVAKADVKTGIKNQAIGNITLTEAAKGALVKDGTVQLRLTDGVKFSEKPEVKVVDGNLDIDQDSINADNGVLSFQVKSESTRASKIEISGVKLDLDRAVAQGDIEAEVGGSALVQNADQATGTAFVGSFQIGHKNYAPEAPAADVNYFDLTNSSIEVGEFDKNFVAKKAIATVVTPADGNARVGEVVFKVGQTTYTEAGVEKTMDVAPFIEASRTYLPVRFVAKSVGVEGSNILFDEATRQVTIIKGDRIAQLTIGSNILKLNGAQIKMDTKAQIVNGRTVLPLRAVATALGAQVDWNEASQTVTVK